MANMVHMRIRVGEELVKLRVVAEEQLQRLEEVELLLLAVLRRLVEALHRLRQERVGVQLAVEQAEVEVVQLLLSNLEHRTALVAASVAEGQEPGEEVLVVGVQELEEVVVDRQELLEVGLLHQVLGHLPKLLDLLTLRLLLLPVLRHRRRDTRGAGRRCASRRRR